jgi:hypothetical protein
MNEKIICPNCESENEQGNIYCGQCGFFLRGSNEQQSEPLTPAFLGQSAEQQSEPLTPAFLSQSAEQQSKPLTPGEAQAVLSSENETEQPVEQGEPAAEAPAAAKKFPLIPVLIAAGIVIAVALLTMLTNYVSGGGGGNYIEPDKYPFELSGYFDDTFILAGYDGEPWIIERNPEKEVRRQISKNGAGTLVAVDYPDRTVIYYITNKTQHTFEVTAAGDMLISDKGNAFLYLEKNDADEYTLMLYRDGAETAVAENVRGKWLAISPGGSALCYMSDDGENDGTYTTYVKIGNVTNELGKDIQVKGIADNGKYIYFQKNDACYVQRGFDESTRVKIANSRIRFDLEFNSDYSQALCFGTDEDGGLRTYFIENGGDPVKLGNDFIHSQAGSKIVKDLKEDVLYSYDTPDTYPVTDGVRYSLYIMNKDLETEKIAKDVLKYRITEDQSIIYQKGEDLYKYPISAGEDEKIIEDVTDFEISKTGKTIYYRNIDNELCCFKNGISTLVSYDFDSFSVSKNGDVYYLDGTEVYKSTGGRGKMIGEADISLSGIDRTLSRIMKCENGYLVLYFYPKTDGAYGMVYPAATFVSTDDKTFRDLGE